MNTTESKDTGSSASQHHGAQHNGPLAAGPERMRDDLRHIQGWGADLDRKDRPAVPMERTPPRLANASAAQPVQQTAHVEVFVSPERPQITPLFGSSAPPSGLSGMLRRLAYKLTENDVRHFMLLLLADRVNVLEGLGQDVLSGHLPNVLGEMGIKAEWQHNRAGLVRKAAIVTTMAGLGYYLLTRRRR